MKLQRTISKYLIDNIPGLHAFKDEIAFVAAGNPYPYMLIDLISTRKSSLGTGIWDRTESTADGDKQVKATKIHQVLRFTIRAADSSEANGNVIVSEISDQIESLLSDFCRDGSVDLMDSVSGENIHIEQVIFQARSDLTPLEKSMPFIYQQSLSYSFTVHHFKTRKVADRIERLTIEI